MGELGTGEELLLRMSRERFHSEMEPTPGEDAAKAVEMTTKGLEYYIT